MRGVTALLVNAPRGRLTGVAATPPGFGDRRRHLSEDIAILTNVSRRPSSGPR